MKEYQIIKKPVFTEKGTKGVESKKYVFVVDNNANKVEIKNAVEKLFGVEVLKVNTVSIKGKSRRRGRIEGYTSDIKKAYIELTAGSKSIEFFDNLK